MLFKQRKLKSFIKDNQFDIPLSVFHAVGMTKTYLAFDDLFYLLPPKLVSHRKYYEQDNRGFGERAFHAAWYWFFRELYQQKQNTSIKMLEIGVYRGQTITLWPLIANEMNLSISVTGLSPFSQKGDSVSRYSDLSYLDDVKEHIRHFSVSDSIDLVEAYSDSPEGIASILDSEWDLIYVDGSHDYEIVRTDVHNAIKSLLPGGLLVIDDSSLLISNHPYILKWKGFKGHPGPSKVCNDIPMRLMIHVLSVGHLNFFIKTCG